MCVFFLGLTSIRGVSESWLLSRWERHLETEILPKAAVYSGLPFDTHSQVEGQAEPVLSWTWPCTVPICAVPHLPALLAWFWPPVPGGDLEGNMGRAPHSSHSWDTQWAVFENPGSPSCPAPLLLLGGCCCWAASPSVPLVLQCSYTILTQRLPVPASYLCDTNPMRWSYLFYCVVLFTIKNSVVVRNWNAVACCLDDSFYTFQFGLNDTPSMSSGLLVSKVEFV